MAGIDQATAQAQLDAFIAASLAISRGQAYQIGTRSFRRADLKEVQDSIVFWDNKVQKLARGGIRIRRAIPLDG